MALVVLGPLLQAILRVTHLVLSRVIEAAFLALALRPVALQVRRVRGQIAAASAAAAREMRAETYLRHHALASINGERP